MRVVDIKCFCDGTDTGSFLKEGDYSGAISSLDLLPSDLDTQESTLTGEMTGGGLDATALNLGGFSPLFEMGYTANKHISSASNSISEIKNIIESDAKTHMTNEWGKYYQEVFKHTEEKKKARDSALSYYNGLADDNSEKSSAYSAYLSAEADYQEHATELSNASTNLESVGGKSAVSSALETDFEKNASPELLVTHKGTGYNSDGSAAEETQASIYQELSNLGYSRAGICAILANMQQESGFDLTAIGDGGTSFGLCQWHNGRWENLNSFCAENGLDPNSVKGQVAFLDYELKNGYGYLYNQLQNADDSEATAKNLAKAWCIDFERPADADQRAIERAGNVSNYWNKTEGVETSASIISGYTSLSSLNDLNNKKTQAVKERDFDTTVTHDKKEKVDTKTPTVAEMRDKCNITEDYRESFQHGEKSRSMQKYIVLHDTESADSAKEIVNTWDENGTGVAAHFIIDRDGSVVQCVPLDEITHHAGYGENGHNDMFGVGDESHDDKVGTTSIGSDYSDYGMNSHSIGIEICHEGGKENYTEAQLESLDNVISYVDAYYDGDGGKIIDHKMWRTTNCDTSAEFSDYLQNYQNSRSHDGK